VESGLRTPLLDFFRRGEVARDIRLLAAQGALAPRAHEQLALLMILVDDHDSEIAGAATATIAAIPQKSLAAFLARPEVSTEMREFFKARGIEPAAAAAEQADAPLVDLAPAPSAIDDLPPPPNEPVPELPPALSGVEGLPDIVGLPELAPLPELDGLSEEAEEEKKKESITQKLAGMTVAQRMGVAMKGSREERSILIRDPNKLVSTSVLSSPKLTESEIEAIAKMQNVSEEILRIVGSNRAWIKNYNVIHALVRNAKTPVAMSMNLLARLADKDLRALSTNRNVPEILRVTARKKVVIDK
jgi:hypothetical protein